MSDIYNNLYDLSISNPEQFWGNVATNIDWIRPWDKVLDDSDAPYYRWFSGGKMNTCYNSVDRHVEAGHGDQIAIIHDSAMTGLQQKISYKTLQQRVASFAGAMQEKGVAYGDRVIIYMPMIPEAAIAMLACARIGAVHSVVFGGFAAAELAVRINDAMPKLIVAASCGLEPGRTIAYKPMLDEAFKLAAHQPQAMIVFQREQLRATLQQGRDFDWDTLVSNAKPADCVSVLATDPLYILYTSGTTGQPKGVVRDNGGHAVALYWSMKNIYNVQPGDVYWAASDVGWVVGHSYIVYGPLLHRNTTVIFEGKPVGTPDPGVFWRVIEEHKVKVLFTAPTAFRAIKKEDSQGEYVKKYDVSSLQSLFLAGERSDPATLQWAQDKLRVPVVDHWWQTETGWSIAANCLGIEQLPIVHGSPTRAAPGWQLAALDEQGEEVASGGIGALVAKLPLPPGAFSGLWRARERHYDAYLKTFPGYYETGDAGFIDENQYVFVMARTDDVINVAGHRLSTGGMEEVLAAHSQIAECAVIGVADSLKGQVPVGLLVVNSDSEKPYDEIVSECVALVRKQIGPVAAFKIACVVKRLPKTRSGKVLRGTMKSIADNTEWKMPATIDDPDILLEIKKSLVTLGYAKK